MDQQELKNVLELHRKWVMGDSDGKRAYLEGANLRGANMEGAYLRGAYLKDAYMEGANLGGANLRGADLRGANLGGANLGGANMEGANLGGANLGGAYLRGAYLKDAYMEGANLRGANLGGANLGGANLGGANLRGANLGDANLRGANLRGANLDGANLEGAYLRGAYMDAIKSDFFAVLSVAKNEVLGLYDALCRGLVDGSTYTGECACLVGTVANIRKEEYQTLGIDLRPDSNRAAERWFLAIRKGDIPQSNPVSAITAEWMREFMDANGIKYPTYEIRAVNVEEMGR